MPMEHYRDGGLFNGDGTNPTRLRGMYLRLRHAVDCCFFHRLRTATAEKIVIGYMLWDFLKPCYNIVGL